MKAVTIKQLKDELTHKSASELKELCLHLSRFKKAPFAIKKMLLNPIINVNKSAGRIVKPPFEPSIIWRLYISNV